MSSSHTYTLRLSISTGVQYALLVALLMQIPLASLADNTHQAFIIGFVLLHIIALVTLRFAQAIGIRNILLCITYASYIVMSGALWQGDYLAHWFLPVGVVFAVFLFRLQRPLQLLCVVVLFNALFLFTEYQWIQWRAESDSDYQRYKGYFNAVLMSGCCTFISLFIRWHLSQFWRGLQTQSSARKKTLDKLLPDCFQQLLASSNQAKLQRFSNVSVLFFDMRGFTEYAANRDTLDQIQMLDAVYRRFDEICASYSIERIKTNGDQYIAAAGVPLTYRSQSTNRLTPALATCLAAIQIQREFQTIGSAYGFVSQGRVGIASGGVTAGVIGLFKPCYDLWGLPMILASRLESTCKDQHIYICKTTYLQVNTSLDCQFIDYRELRGLGTCPIYALEV